MRPLTCHGTWSYKQFTAHRQCNGTESITVVPSTTVWSRCQQKAYSGLVVTQSNVLQDSPLLSVKC